MRGEPLPETFSGAEPAPKIARRLGPAALVSLCVTLTIAATLGAMIYVLRSAQDEFTLRDRKAQMQLVANSVASAMDQANRFALSQAEASSRRQAVIDALAANDRDALIRANESLWTYLNKQAGVQIFGFHDPNLHYLLRMHKRESYGDDISGFRMMVVAANRLRRAQSGIELGIGGIGLRGVAPVMQGEKLVGTVEAGLDVKPLLENVKSATNANIAVLVAPALASVALDPKWRAFGELTLAASTDDALFAALLSAGAYGASRENVFTDVRLAGHVHSAGFIPLVDFAGRQVGVTVILREVSETDRRRVGADVWIVAICGAIAAFVIFFALFRVVILQRGRI